MSKQTGSPADILQAFLSPMAVGSIALAMPGLSRQAVQLSLGGIGNVWNLNAAIARSTLATICRLPGLPSAQNPAKFVTSSGKACKLTQKSSPLTVTGHSRAVQRPAKEHKKLQASMQKGTAAFAVVPGYPMSSNSPRPMVARPPARIPQVASDDWLQVNIGLQSSLL